MSEISWIKLKLNMFDDEKIRIIENMDGGDAKLIIWIKLLTLAGKCNMNGLLMISDTVCYTADMLSVVINRKPAEVKMALDTFNQFGMIDFIDGVISISNWDKHQNQKSLEEVREKGRKRVERFREKNKCLVDKAIDSNDTQKANRFIDNKDDDKCNVTCNVTETLNVTLPSNENKELENKDNTITNVIVPIKKSASAIHPSIKKIFSERYYELFNATYYWKAKDAGACEQLIKQVKSLLRTRSPDFTDENVIETARYIISNITDKWILEHFSMTVINSQFNEIIAQIKKSRPNSGISKANETVNQLLEKWKTEQ